MQLLEKFLTAFLATGKKMLLLFTGISFSLSASTVFGSELAEQTQTSLEKSQYPSSDYCGPNDRERIKIGFFNTTTQENDPRFHKVPRSINRVELLPQWTFRAKVPRSTHTVSFFIDGVEYQDHEPPFLSSVSPDSPTSLTMDVGTHHIAAIAYNKNGAVVAETQQRLEITDAGSDPSPEDGEHSIHRIWLTASGRYVQRDEKGDFVDVKGNLVLAASDVSLEIRGDDQGFLVSNEGAPDEIVFAFIILLPEGFDRSVRYPVLTFLHHGWEVYRGTDNDGRPLDTPLFTGINSISASENRNKFPAVVYVPQLPFHGEIDGVNHQWGAFTDRLEESSSVASAEELSIGAGYALGVLDDLLAGDVSVDGLTLTLDSQRQYLAGHSLGGVGTWDWIQRFPNRFAAAVPMAGYADHSKAALLTNMPIWVFHHQIDCYNLYVGNETMFQLIQEAGGKAIKFTSLDFDTGGACDQAHFQTPNAAWATESLMDWIFSQVQSKKQHRHRKGKRYRHSMLLNEEVTSQ